MAGLCALSVKSLNPKIPIDALARAIRPAIPALALPALVFAAGCRTPAPLPPADFSAPGWRVQQGQALWKPPKARDELAGELICATNANGNCFVQFSKNPFPIATARIAGPRWQMAFGTANHLWSGEGPPPARLVWFQLPRALAGAMPPGAWQFEHLRDSWWRLANPLTGESLEGRFFP
jgi:hypothetical protein